MSSNRYALYASMSLVVFWATAEAQEHRDAARHFTFNIPAGWEKLSPQMLATANELGKRINVIYDAGYQPAGQAPGQYPYMLVQIHSANLASASYEEIEREMATGVPGGIRQAEGALGDLVKDLKLGSVVVDRTRNRAVLRIELASPLGRKIQAISYGAIGRDGIVWLHCYAYDEFDRHLPTFNDTADSFQYDQGFHFVARQGNPLRGAVIGGIVGGVVVGLAAFLYTLYRKSRGDHGKR